MRITLQIENVDRLESGGQVSYSCSDRGFDIGRHDHLDWSLPDPQRVVSGKHCEVRYEGGQFVLYDVSTNGTFVNGSPNRMDKAHALRSGDRLMIGDYIIAVTLDTVEASSAGVVPSASAAAPAPSAPWQSPVSSAPAPVAHPSAAVPPAPPSQWPASQPAAPAPYPGQGAPSPWDTPSAGMEGRHAPPSQTPGIGTPADDVWNQKSHGWGSADPALYDPQAQPQEREPVRPAQADPMDHLAPQPNLHPQSDFPPPPQDPVQPQPQAAPLAEAPPAPLFQMPDFADTPGEASAGARAADAQPSQEPEPPLPAASSDVPLGAQASPFPESVAAPSAPFEAEDTPFPHGPGSTAQQEKDAASDAQPTSQQDATAPVLAIETTAAAEPASPPDVKAENASLLQAQTAADPVPEASVNQGPAPAGEVDFLKAFAEGAGIPETVLAGRDAQDFARELGALLQGVTGDMMGLLQARSQVKAMTRNTNRTLIGRSGNNALKFSPTPQMALQTMLSANVEENGYLTMSKAMSAAFKDIQKHHVWTYAAMQKAAGRFDDTLSPKAIEAEAQAPKSTFGNQKAKLWERMQERWSALSGAYDDGLVGVFTQYFTESYEELSSEDPEA